MNTGALNSTIPLSVLRISRSRGWSGPRSIPWVAALTFASVRIAGVHPDRVVAVSLTNRDYPRSDFVVSLLPGDLFPTAGRSSRADWRPARACLPRADLPPR